MAVRAYAPINYYTNERFTDEVELRKVVLVPFMRCALAFREPDTIATQFQRLKQSPKVHIEVVISQERDCVFGRRHCVLLDAAGEQEENRPGLLRH